MLASTPHDCIKIHGWDGRTMKRLHGLTQLIAWLLRNVSRMCEINKAL